MTLINDASLKAIKKGVAVINYQRKLDKALINLIKFKNQKEWITLTSAEKKKINLSIKKAKEIQKKLAQPSKTMELLIKKGIIKKGKKYNG